MACGRRDQGRVDVDSRMSRASCAETTESGPSVPTFGGFGARSGGGGAKRPGSLRYRVVRAGRMRGGGSGPDQLDVQSDLDPLADEDAAAFDRGVPREVEVLAVSYTHLRA